MKYIITEEQHKKLFNKIGKVEGPLTNTIEEVITDLMDDPNVCDYIVTYVEGADMYAILVMTNLPMSYTFEKTIKKLIVNYIGITPLVLVNDSYGCKNTVMGGIEETHDI